MSELKSQFDDAASINAIYPEGTPYLYSEHCGAYPTGAASVQALCPPFLGKFVRKSLSLTAMLLLCPASWCHSDVIPSNDSSQLNRPFRLWS